MEPPFIKLIPYNCGAGAENNGCEEGPLTLKEYKITSYLRKSGYKVEWEKFLNTKTTKHTDNLERLRLVEKHCNYLNEKVSVALSQDYFPITIGGDHSMAIGTWTGVASSLYTRRKLGLIWIDAHMDAHTTQTSSSGNYHGMPISYLLGYGNDVLSNITGRMPVIMPNHLCLIGIRSFETEEAEMLQKAGARIFLMEEVKQRGLDQVMLEAVKIVSTNTAGFGISIDIDAFDPKEAPGTGTRADDGIQKTKFFSALDYAMQGYGKALLAIEIAEYNPRLDVDFVTASLMRDIIIKLLKFKTYY